MKTDFFYGANTSQGFISFFREMYDESYKAYLIKGGPGTGKSTIIKSISARADENGENIITAPCSSDPQSLDAVILPDRKICIVDATPPHTLEPEIPGVVEKIINLGDCWDEKILKQSRHEITELTKGCSVAHRKSMQFLSAASTLKKDSIRLASQLTDMKKLRRFSVRFATKNFNKPNGKLGREYHRFLSALTPNGITFFADTIEKMCNNITVLKDEYGSASSVILHEIRSYAIGCGYDVISSPSPLMPDLIQHIIIPELKLAVVTQNCFYNKKFPKQKTVNTDRFITEKNDKINRFSYNGKVQRELIDSAIEQMQKAKALHDKLEGFYKNAINFELVSAKQNEIINEIFSENNP